MKGEPIRRVIKNPFHVDGLQDEIILRAAGTTKIYTLGSTSLTSKSHFYASSNPPARASPHFVCGLVSGLLLAASLYLFLSRRKSASLVSGNSKQHVVSDVRELDTSSPKQACLNGLDSHVTSFRKPVQRVSEDGSSMIGSPLYVNDRELTKAGECVDDEPDLKPELLLKGALVAISQELASLQHESRSRDVTTQVTKQTKRLIEEFQKQGLTITPDLALEKASKYVELSLITAAKKEEEYRSFLFQGMQKQLDRKLQTLQHAQSISALREDKDWYTKLRSERDRLLALIWTALWRSLATFLAGSCSGLIVGAAQWWSQTPDRILGDVLSYIQVCRPWESRWTSSVVSSVQVTSTWQCVGQNFAEVAAAIATLAMIELLRWLFIPTVVVQALYLFALGHFAIANGLAPVTEFLYLGYLLGAASLFSAIIVSVRYQQLRNLLEKQKSPSNENVNRLLARSEEMTMILTFLPLLTGVLGGVAFLSQS